MQILTDTPSVEDEAEESECNFSRSTIINVCNTENASKTQLCTEDCASI